LNFIGTMATMLIGVMVGRLLQSELNPRRLRRILAVGAVAGIVTALGANGTVCPIVKSIWTSSWVLFSGGLVVLIFVLFHWMSEFSAARYALRPLAIAGSNSILLYVLASNYRWVVVGVWQRLFGPEVFVGAYEPVVTSLAVALALLLGAAVLNAFGLRLRM
jgi:predicted acyltransferase